MFRSDIIHVYTVDSVSGWWRLCNRTQQRCLTVLEGDCHRAGKSEVFSRLQEEEEEGKLAGSCVRPAHALTPC